MKTSHDYLHFVRVVMLFSSYVVDQIRFYTSLRKMQILSLRILKKCSQAFVFQYMILLALYHEQDDNIHFSISKWAE